MKGASMSSSQYDMKYDITIKRTSGELEGPHSFWSDFVGFIGLANPFNSNTKEATNLTFSGDIYVMN